MAVSQTSVVGPVYLPGLTSPENAKIIFELSSWDKEDGEAVFVTGPYVADIDNLGDFSVDLFTSAEGENGVVYHVSIHYLNYTGEYKREFLGTVSLSGPGPYNLADLEFVDPMTTRSFDLLAEMGAYKTEIEALINGEAAIIFANGVVVEPGSDINADLITVVVTGTPTFRWNESLDRFELTHGLSLGTSLPVALGTIELGHASDTTLSRSAAGEVAVEGNPLAQKNPNRITQTGTSYDLLLTDAGKIVTMNNGSANTVNIQANASEAYPTNCIIEIRQLGAGITTIQAPSGVIINGVDGGGAAISNRYQSVGLFRESSDTWIIDGAHEDVA
jgi:hypothetical protein